jgi:lysyl-tRNA synthetase class 2
MQAEGFVTLALPLPAAVQRFLPGRAKRPPHLRQSGYAAAPEPYAEPAAGKRTPVGRNVA